MVGVPAVQIGWMSAYGKRLNIPLTGNVETTCPDTKERYVLNGNSLERIDEFI